MKKDNSTFSYKRQLRLHLLKEISNPVIMETHGGKGKIFKACYNDFSGIVFEKEGEKAELLAIQRPNWFVYECNCLDAIEMGAGKGMGINFVDIDPYGDPWPVINTFFNCENYRPNILAMAVNDGLRLKLKMGGAWAVGSVQTAIKKYGNAEIGRRYKEICQETMIELANNNGYQLKRWTSYYCGYAKQITHYAAILYQR